MIPFTSHTFRRMAGRVLPVLVLWTCGMLAETIDAQYRAQVEQWRQQREAGLKADGGWLTVTGLFRLKDGDNTIGSDPSNDILLPNRSPAHLGNLKLASDHATFTPSGPGVTLSTYIIRSLPNPARVQ